MSQIFYDIIPPKITAKTEKSSDFASVKKAIVKIVAFLVIVSLNWAGLSAVIRTIAYLNDSEISLGNIFSAGTLDFSLDSPSDFSPSAIGLGESATRTINFLNQSNVPKYEVKADNFSGSLCQYLTLEANLDGGATLYSGNLIAFIYGPIEFADPDAWQFTLTLSADAPEETQGQTCQFNFIFSGSQVRNNLLFGEGFNDSEQITNNISSKVCHYVDIRSCGYWKNHSTIYAPHLPQTLGDEVVNTAQKANAILQASCGNCGCGCDKTMRAKLKGQLLAMKFNIAHFGIGGYIPDGDTRTLDEIVAEADGLLQQNPPPPDSVLEAMKNILDQLNSLGRIRYCSGGTGGSEPGLVINKVYYDVDSKHGSEPDNEWIELYNPTDNEIDVSGWIIKDNNSQDVIPQSEPIRPMGFAIITGKNSTFNYWEIPPDVIKIVLPDGKIGNGLANDGDRIILEDSLGTEIDAMSYGTDTYAFNPSCPDVTEGHILGRVPAGFDTDQDADWVDLGLPEVTVIYPNGGEVLWVGRTYEIQWEAKNQNGLDGDLTIDIWYSADSGASWANIAKGTENDGSYDWRIPLFINGYYVPSGRARIKVVAHGPENFMIESWDMSDSDFCPPIDYNLLTPDELAMLEIYKAAHQDWDVSGNEEPAAEEPVVEEPVTEEPQTPAEAPVETPEDNPVDTPAETPASSDSSGSGAGEPSIEETPTETPTDTPTEQPTDLPAESPVPAPENPTPTEEPAVIPDEISVPEDNNTGDISPQPSQPENDNPTGEIIPESIEIPSPEVQ
jgi:hypothetical protein